MLADWFQSKGAPRGELIALHLRAERDPSVVATAKAYLDDHAEALLGPLIDHVKMHDESARDAFTWHRGYIQRAALSYDHDAVELDIGLDAILEQLLQHPSGRLLQELAIGLNGEVSENTLDDLIAVIAAERPSALRSLHLGDFVYGEQTEMSWYEVGDLSPLWPCLPRLGSLIVQGGAFDLGTIEAPALEHAEFRTGGLSIASATAIAAAMWPRLRRLDVWYGDPNFGGDTTIDHVRLLLQRRDLTALTHLGLRNAAHTDAICAALAETPPILATVRELDLSMGTMTDAGAAVLANAGLHFELLDVERNFLTPAGVAMLRPIAATLAHDDQSSDQDRYPSVGE